jgi:thiamine biosynthesis lipoprotein ApbE
MAADGLSTAAMVLGRDRGLELIASQGAAAILITPDGAITTAGDLDIEELA